MMTRLRTLRGAAGLEEFTKLCGLSSKSALDRWKRGESEPKASDLTKIGKACGISVDWLLGLKEDKSLKPVMTANQRAAFYAVRHGQGPCPHCAAKDEVIANLSKALANVLGPVKPTAAARACGADAGGHNEKKGA